MLVSLDANSWRMLRRLLRAHPEPQTFRVIRNWVRWTADVRNLDRLAADGLVVAGPETPDVNDRTFRLTDAGVAAADLGEYQR